MTKYLVLAAFGFLAIGSAKASTDDSVTLMLTGSSGVVLTYDNMTQRECEAVVGLLSARPVTDSISSGAFIIGSAYPSNSNGPKTPAITSAKCVKPTAK